MVDTIYALMFIHFFFWKKSEFTMENVPVEKLELQIQIRSPLNFHLWKWNANAITIFDDICVNECNNKFVLVVSKLTSV